MTEHVMLVGMMGSGKTTVGRLLAARLGRTFHDSDAEIAAKTGRTVADIFAERGEAAFRAEEKAVLAKALSTGVPGVIAIAGGAVLDPESRSRIHQSGVVIWLRAAPWVLAKRVGSGTHRPLLEHDASGTLRLLDAKRRPVYRAVADAVVDADWASPAAVAERVEHLVREMLEARAS